MLQFHYCGNPEYAAKTAYLYNLNEWRENKILLASLIIQTYFRNIEDHLLDNLK